MDHFSVDGTLLQAWASTKSYRPRDEQDPPARGGRNPDVEFRGERRSRETHVSDRPGSAALEKRAQSEAARLCYMGHALVENRHGIVVDMELTQARGGAERAAAIAMVDQMEGRKPGINLGADKAYDTYAFRDELAARDVTQRAWNDGLKQRPIPEALASDRGYLTSQRRRKIVEEVFGWMKTDGRGRKLR
jgi:hypothetical protein